MSETNNPWHLAIIDQQSGSPRAWRRALKRRYQLSFFDTPQQWMEQTSLDPDQPHPELPHLVIVDWDGANGQAGDMVKTLRHDHNNGLGVIAVVEEDDPDAALAACAMGANDYITRPLEEYELSTRIVNLLTHRPKNLALPEYYPPYRFDLNRRTVSVEGQVHRPRPREFDLMLFMFRRPDQVVTRAQLKDSVWFGESDDCRSIDTYISRCRRLYGLNGSTGWQIKSVYGSGYRLLMHKN